MPLCADVVSRKCHLDLKAALNILPSLLYKRREEELATCHLFLRVSVRGETLITAYKCLKHSYSFTVENKWHVHKECALVVWFYSLPSCHFSLAPSSSPQCKLSTPREWVCYTHTTSVLHNSNVSMCSCTCARLCMLPACGLRDLTLPNIKGRCRL